MKYLETHEWFKEDDGIITVGISEYAQGELGDIVFIEFPSLNVFVTMPVLNEEFQKGSSVVELEATKTIAEVYAPFDCTVIEVNDSLNTEPELINNDPLNSGWIYKASVKEYSDIGMSEKEYFDFIY